MQQKSTSYCSYTNVSLDKHSKLLKALGIQQLPTKHPKKDLKESMWGPEGKLRHKLMNLATSNLLGIITKRCLEICRLTRCRSNKFKRSKKTAELGNGALYHQLQWKMTKMFTRYTRWVHGHRRNNSSIHHQRRTTAAETIHGFQKFNTSRQRKTSNTTLFGSDESYKKDKKNKIYGVCQYDHRMWQCSIFQEQDVNC